MNYYLQAESEEALFAALESAGVMNKVYDPEDPLNIPPESGWSPTGEYANNFADEIGLDDRWEPTGKYDLYPKAGIDLDVIGTIWKPTGETTIDEEGNLIQVSAPLEGYHANIRGITAEQAEALPTIAKPNNPVRMWAGDE